MRIKYSGQPGGWADWRIDRVNGALYHSSSCSGRCRVFGRSAMRWFVAGSLALFALQGACAEEPAKHPKPAQAAKSQGSDWPSFLGPTGDSKSSERGILTRWPEDGPPLVWQLAVGHRLWHARHPAPAGCFNSTGMAIRRGCDVWRARRASRCGRSSIPAIFRICTATTTARDARRSWTRSAFISSAPRACCTA